MALRLVAGIEPQEDFPARPLLEELLRERHLLIADHTRRHWKTEFSLPGPIIDRARRDRWEQEGSPTVRERAHRQIDRLLRAYCGSPLSDDLQRELTARMEYEARRYGLSHLPARK
jgi:trimethylamine:corrinoid methyltransferase-like protein